MRCNEKIETFNGARVSYCSRPCGHEGRHVDNTVRKPQCESVFHGMRCGLPLAHTGKHEARLGAPSWETSQQESRESAGKDSTSPVERYLQSLV